MPNVQPCEICGTPEQGENDTYRIAGTPFKNKFLFRRFGLRRKDPNSVSARMGFLFERVCQSCRESRAQEFARWQRRELKNWVEGADGISWGPGRTSNV